MVTIHKDIVILGGGIAGLWLLDRLTREGFDTVLLDQDPLGSGQTIASQGMIHGGIKYALGGGITGASDAVAEMPDHWRACLAGEQTPDLRGANVLSHEYFMWPRESIRSRLNAFLGSKMLRGRVDPLPAGEYPDFFKGRIKGPLYRLQDMVLDVPSLLHVLSAPHKGRIHGIDWARSRIVAHGAGAIDHLEIAGNGQENFHLRGSRYVLAAGKGSGTLMETFSLPSVPMQLRPLRMVMAKHDFPAPLYVHCVSERLTTAPEVTITTHPAEDGGWVWYLGGALAEAGAHRSPEEQLAVAADMIGELFPWHDFSGTAWSSLYIERAEPARQSGTRPDHSFVQCLSNFLVCWPVKLTLAPTLADKVMEELARQHLEPGTHRDPTPLPLPFPGIARPPWEEAFS